MTYEDAQNIVAHTNLPHYKMFIEWTAIRQEADGSYSVIIEPVHGEQQIHSDVEKAHWAVVQLLADLSKENDRYFMLSEDGTPVECDRETYTKDTPNREKTRIEIVCSPKIKASISFFGWIPAVSAIDGDLRFWTAGFCKTAANEHFGGTAFKTQDQAKAFVARFIELGCPEPGSPHWGQLNAEFPVG